MKNKKIKIMKLTILTTLFGTNSRPDITTTKQEAIPVEENSPSEPLLISRFDSDVEALRKKYGDLETGLTIEITLQELLKICPRKRTRVDAYQGLVSYLKSKYEVTLNIKSRKKERRI